MTIALLIASVVLAAFTVLCVKPTSSNRLKLLIAFSGSYLLSITSLHLLPEVFSNTVRGAYFGAFVLVGFFLQVMLEYLSKGIEHGHVHHDKNSAVPIALLVGLCIHAFLEGMPLVGAEEGHNHGHSHDHGHDSVKEECLDCIVFDTNKNCVSEVNEVTFSNKNFSQYKIQYFTNPIEFDVEKRFLSRAPPISK